MRRSRITAAALGDHPLGLVLGYRERDVERVAAETWICSPGPARSTSHSSIVFVSRPSPEISTSTTSPGPIGREFAGVPVRITSPGSSVISRQRSASW